MMTWCLGCKGRWDMFIRTRVCLGRLFIHSPYYYYYHYYLPLVNEPCQVHTYIIPITPQTDTRYTDFLVQSHHAHTFLCCVYISRVGSVDMYIKILLTLPFFFFFVFVWLLIDTQHSSFFLWIVFLFNVILPFFFLPPFSRGWILHRSFNISTFQHLIISDFKRTGLVTWYTPLSALSGPAITD